MNWDCLPDSYYIYPRNRNAFLQLIIDRPTFTGAIYNTDVYKKVKYCHEKYGKLHDIVFMMEVGSYGNTVFLHGGCIRWRQHRGSDSNDLKSGPFIGELIEIISETKRLFIKECDVRGIKKIAMYSIFLALLFNFSCFLWQWSAGERFVTWKQFKRSMVEKGIFPQPSYWWIDNTIDIVFNPIIRRMATNMRKKYTSSYKYRIGAS